jgi:phosphatidylinositol glycan class T
VVLEFEKAFLTINDYPPDVSRGFDVCTTLYHTRSSFISSDPSLHLSCLDQQIQSGVLVVLAHKEVPLDTDVVMYSSSALVLLPSPDFSMPFNVIAFTSTVMTNLFIVYQSFSYVLMPHRYV